MIVLTSDHMQQILAHALREAPDEACGLLGGRDGRIVHVYSMQNAVPGVRRLLAYRLDPEEQYRVFMEIESAGLDLVGIYHSHPRGEAYPSMTDVSLAYYPGVVYLIVSLLHADHPVARAFFIDGQETLETGIRIENGR
jgi:[CysO sulfur-carrier protein]-S-L-cysteine hydrolase